MINEASLRAVEAAQWGQHFVKPLYDSYCFSQIPRTVHTLLTGAEPGGLPIDTLGPLYQTYDVVVLFFVDAFGWRFIERYADEHPFLRRIFAEGVVSKLTSQFPSTTAAHVTTIHTDLPPGESGVFEWFYYEPQLDQIIAPLLFSYAGDRSRNTLRDSGVTPEALYPQGTLYQSLHRHGVRSFRFQHRDYVYSPFSQMVAAGAEPVPYVTLAEGLVNLAQHIRAQQDPAYYFMYLDSIDATCHRYGPESPQVAAEIDLFLDAMERIFLGMLGRPHARALLLLTADHGQTAIDPATTVYLNQTMPGIREYLRTNRDGAPLAPAGSSRDMFLYVKDDRLGEAIAQLQDHLAGRAEVHRVANLIDQGFFGPTAPSPAFLGRVGNLVILPYQNEAIWWYEQGRFDQHFYGSHGGLIRDEMETALLAWGL